MSNAMNDAAWTGIGVSFPLTPALSLGERENRFPSLARTCVGVGGTRFRISQKLRWPFPLPEGEGQGEGEQKQRMFAA